MNIDWAKAGNEAVQMLQQLIRINTVNPPGNESEAAVFVKGILEKEGIETAIYESAQGRGNLVARIPGNGSQRPLMLLSHLDVVCANPEQWRHDPFAAVVEDGYVWGRGTLDMKGMLAMEILTMLLMKRSGITPSRDILLVAAADEEAGGDFGMKWLFEQGIPGLTETEFVINEGGEGTLRDGVPVYACQNGEKGVLWVKVTFPGIPGHASMPAGENAVWHLMKFLARVQRIPLPVTLNETSRGFLTGLVGLKKYPLPDDPEAREKSLKLFAQRHFSRERSVKAMLANTISPTVLRAGEKTNVLPERASVSLDCRLLPGETPEGFLEMIKQNIHHPEAEIEVIHAAPPTISPLDTDLYRAMDAVVRKNHKKALLVPYLSPGGTDSRYFRKRGITAYGFMPIVISEAELQTMHGIDERISLENMERGSKILFETVWEVGQG